MTIAIWALAGAQRYPPFWVLVGAVLAGNVVVTLLTPLFSSITLESAFRGWLLFGPLVVLLSILLWFRLRWAKRRRGHN